MTGCERVLHALSDGEWHDHLSLYRLGVVLHSRISDLRKRGHHIETRRNGDHYLYRLLNEASGRPNSGHRYPPFADETDPEPSLPGPSLNSRMLTETPDGAPSPAPTVDSLVTDPVGIVAGVSVSSRPVGLLDERGESESSPPATRSSSWLAAPWATPGDPASGSSPLRRDEAAAAGQLDLFTGEAA